MHFGSRNDVRSRESVKIAQRDETNATAATKMPEIRAKCSQRQVFAKSVPPPYEIWFDASLACHGRLPKALGQPPREVGGLPEAPAQLCCHM